MLKVLRRITNRPVRIQSGGGDTFLPGRIRSRDVFVTSYPKSGNTWLRFMLANLIAPPDTEIDFYNSNHFIPEVGQDPQQLEDLSDPRLMKSHAPFQLAYPRTVYVVRDGRDVYVSYYHHRRKHLQDGLSFDAYLRQTPHWPGRWAQHTKGWLDAADAARDRILVVRYEAMIDDPKAQLQRVASWIGLKTTPARMEAAVANASATNMRRIEQEKGRPYKAVGPEQFVRSAKPGDWNEWFGAAEKAWFKEYEGKMLIRLGYEQGHDW